MVIMKLLENTQEKCIYSYQIEGQNEPGILEGNKKTESVSIVQFAYGDDASKRLYRPAAMARVMQFMKEEAYPESHTIYWG